jgi:hypothetical protein
VTQQTGNFGVSPAPSTSFDRPATPTAGDWYVEEDGLDLLVISTGGKVPGGKVIAEISDHADIGETLANAYLVAGSKKMHEALTRILYVAGKGDDLSREDLAQVQAAVRSATPP